MDQSRIAATTDFVVVDGYGDEQRLERPRSARRKSQRHEESRVSPTFSTTSTIDDDDDDDEEEFPPVVASRVVGPVLDQGAWLTPCCDHPLL